MFVSADVTTSRASHRTFFRGVHCWLFANRSPGLACRCCITVVLEERVTQGQVLEGSHAKSKRVPSELILAVLSNVIWYALTRWF